LIRLVDMTCLESQKIFDSFDPCFGKDRGVHVHMLASKEAILLFTCNMPIEGQTEQRYLYVEDGLAFSVNLSNNRIGAEHSELLIIFVTRRRGFYRGGTVWGPDGREGEILYSLNTKAVRMSQTMRQQSFLSLLTPK
jgi:hypothetical protein